MQEKSSPVRLDASLGLQPVLQQGQREGQREEFYRDSPDQTSDRERGIEIPDNESLCSQGARMQSVTIAIDDIYEKAAKTFHTTAKEISRAEY